ncbi:hypothetical protein, partial [Streptomyces sp. NPDC096153]|uniref:hypothetical protein n=1 Tax=Streptomyces sp. NPDC096153 TaxID=3155548 RepID=UPI0033216834
VSPLYHVALRPGVRAGVHFCFVLWALVGVLVSGGIRPRKGPDDTDGTADAVAVRAERAAAAAP